MVIIHDLAVSLDIRVKLNFPDAACGGVCMVE